MKYITVGKIHQPHGLEGELRVSFEAFFMPYIDGIKILFLKENEAAPIPWFVEHLAVKSPKLIILKLDGLSSRTDAQNLNGTVVEVRASEYPQLHESLEMVEEWNFAIGFELLLANGESIGKIEEIFYTTHQTLAELTRDGKTILLPMHEDFIVELKEDAQQIILDLPEGLLDLEE